MHYDIGSESAVEGPQDGHRVTVDSVSSSRGEAAWHNHDGGKFLLSGNEAGSIDSHGNATRFAV